MRIAPIILVVTAILFGVALVASTEDIGTVESANGIKAANAKAKQVASAKLRAKYYRTMADLIEAQVVDTPDPARIDALTKEVQRLRTQLRADLPSTRGHSSPRFGDPDLGLGVGPQPGPT